MICHSYVIVRFDANEVFAWFITRRCCIFATTMERKVGDPHNISISQAHKIYFHPVWSVTAKYNIVKSHRGKSNLCNNGYWYFPRFFLFAMLYATASLLYHVTILYKRKSNHSNSLFPTLYVWRKCLLKISHYLKVESNRKLWVIVILSPVSPITQ
jgi:hypothetical protein